MHEMSVITRWEQPHKNNLTIDVLLDRTSGCRLTSSSGGFETSSPITLQPFRIRNTVFTPRASLQPVLVERLIPVTTGQQFFRKPARFATVEYRADGQRTFLHRSLPIRDAEEGQVIDRPVFTLTTCLHSNLWNQCTVWCCTVLVLPRCGACLRDILCSQQLFPISCNSSWLLLPIWKRDGRPIVVIP